MVVGSMACRTREARGDRGDIDVSRDPDLLAAHLEDASQIAGAHADGVAHPKSEADIAALLRAHSRVLVVGAQSSVTGGATPFGEVVVSTARLNRIIRLDARRATVQAGLPLATLLDALRARGATYPPTPTFTGAFVGGTVATNAAGAATFKYGSTRGWVEALTVVLANGEVLDLVRGECRASGGAFTIRTSGGDIHVPVPDYTMPDVPKRSAGYFARPDMDLVDLFVGAEGTLGVITEVTVRVVSPTPALAVAFVLCPSEQAGIALAAALREASRETWRTQDPRGIDAAAIEHMDARSLTILREDGVPSRLNVTLSRDAAVGLLVQLELPPGTSSAAAYDEISGALADDAPDTALVRFCRLLDRFGVLDATELAAPDDRRRVEQLIALREAIATGVNHRIALAKHTTDGRIAKVSGDMIVPFDRFEEMMGIYRRGLESRGLDYVIYGHISDGNVHPNVLPRSFADVVAAREAMLDFGREVTRLGGCPLAEHGVGRNPVKQALLRQLYGDRGIEQMRAVKRALDPHGKLAPGVIFPYLSLPA